MNAWQHLPNASLIDWVIASVKVNPEKWATAQDAARDAILNATWDAAYDAAYDAARNAAYDAAWNAACDATWDAAYDATWDAAYDAVCEAAWISARVTLATLVAYDDCDQYLSMSYEQLLTYAILSERPQAVLLLPLKWIQEHECLVTPA